MSKRTRAIAPVAIIAALAAAPTSSHRSYAPSSRKKKAPTDPEQPKKLTIFDRARLWAAKEKRERKRERRRGDHLVIPGPPHDYGVPSTASYSKVQKQLRRAQKARERGLE